MPVALHLYTLARVHLDEVAAGPFLALEPNVAAPLRWQAASDLARRLAALKTKDAEVEILQAELKRLADASDRKTAGLGDTQRRLGHVTETLTGIAQRLLVIAEQILISQPYADPAYHAELKAVCAELAAYLPAPSQEAHAAKQGGS